jgi:hypothetical protein
MVGKVYAICAKRDKMCDVNQANSSPFRVGRGDFRSQERKVCPLGMHAVS